MNECKGVCEGIKEVLGAVSRLKCGKVSGVDEVKAEYLKSGGYVCVE